MISHLFLHVLFLFLSGESPPNGHPPSRSCQVNELMRGRHCTSPGYCVNNYTSCTNQGQFCYSLWMNMSGVVSVLSQGCYTHNYNCLNQTCTHHGAPRIRHGKELYFCCCNTDFCNRQFSLSFTGNATPTPKTSKLESSRFQNSICHKIPKIRLIFFKSPFGGSYF